MRSERLCCLFLFAFEAVQLFVLLLGVEFEVIGVDPGVSFCCFGDMFACKLPCCSSRDGGCGWCFSVSPFQTIEKRHHFILT